MPEDNQSTQTQDTTQTQQTQTQETFAWKSHLPADFVNSPTIQKFKDDKDGFSNVIKSHLELEKMMGGEKVPIPKGDDDKEGWNRFSKAMGIPDKAEQYGLADAEVPENLKALTFDKGKFAEIVHAHKLTPGQAKGLWGAYTNMVKETYANMIKTRESEMTQVANQLRSDWGDAYDTNVELGQLVINKFSSDKDMEDYVTASILKNPMGAKFLAKIGNQFAENKIGDFGYKKFSLTADQAQTEIDQILRDPKHPYNDDKVATREREKAIDYVNSLYSVIARSK